MKLTTKALTSLVLVVALICAGYLWVNRRTPDTPADAHIQRPKDIPQAEVKNSSAKSAEIPATPEPSEKPASGSHGPLPPDFSKVVTTQPGIFRKYASNDFATYLEFMILGSEGSDPIFAQRQFDLTDEEMKKLLAFSKATLQLDQKNQAAEQENICSKIGTFHSLYELGVALNGFTKKVEAYQEFLGRDAATKLDPLIFSKIDSRLRTQPHNELMDYDFPALFAAQNRDLETEKERVCSFGKSIPQQ